MGNSSVWNPGNSHTVTGGAGGDGGAAGTEGGMGILWTSPTANINVHRTTSSATTHRAAQYTITFDATEGRLSTTNKSLIATLGCELPDCIPNPIRWGCLFDGWTTVDGVEYYGASGSKSLSSYPTAANITLYANWIVDESMIQTIEFADIGQQVTTNTVVLDALASSGLEVEYAVTGPVALQGNELTFTGAGTVTVTASQDGDENWFAAEPVVVSFEVVKAEAEVLLLGLAQVYDGEAKAVGVVTVPEGLTVAVTYDGGAVAPMNAGEYAVAAVVEDAIWAGSATGTLVVAKAAQSIDFAEIGAQVATNAVTLGATASSGLAVAYAVEGPAVLDGNVLTFTGTGDVRVTASQAGNGNWEAAEPVVREFGVSKGRGEVVLSGLAQVYDGGAKAVGVVTVPEGLTVRVTYDGAEAAPVEAGSYDVRCETIDEKFEGSILYVHSSSSIQ